MFEKVRAGVPSATLDIVGVMPDQPLPPGVTVHGRLAKNDRTEAAKLDELYRHAAFLVVLSRHEAFGIVFCEAAGYGVPAIATRVGGISAIVEDGRTGLTFALDESPARIAAEMIALKADAARYSHFARASRSRYETSLNWNAWA